MAKKKSASVSRPQTRSKKEDIKLMRELVHVLGIFTLFVGPLIMYFVREEAPIRSETKKVLNWQFSLLIYLVAASILSNILYFILPLDAVLILINIVLSIIGFVKVTNNQHWEYPLAISFFKK